MDRVFWLLAVVVGILFLIEYARVYLKWKKEEQYAREMKRDNSEWVKIVKLLAELNWISDSGMSKETPYTRLWRKEEGEIKLELEVSGTWENPSDLVLWAWAMEGEEMWDTSVSVDFEDPTQIVPYLRDNLQDRVDRVAKVVLATRPSGPASEAA